MVAVMLLFDDDNCFWKYQGNVTVIVLRFTGHATLQSVVKSNTQLFLWYNVKDSAFEAQSHVNACGFHIFDVVLILYISY